MTPYILCADDFGLTDGISRSILALLAAGRLTATSAMTNRPHWKRLAGALMPHGTAADIGLHFNLTCAEPLSSMAALAPSGRFPALAQVARGAMVSADVRREIASELDCQLDAFEAAAGKPPDFVDGHQHVHVLPGVRAAVLDTLARRYPAGTVWLRNPSDKAGAIRERGVATAKALTIAGLASGLASAAGRRGIPVNLGFAGASPFDPARDFGDDFARFLTRPGPRHLVMCHPGFIDDELEMLDPVTLTRPLEHAFLMGEDVRSLGRLVRFRDASA